MGALHKAMVYLGFSADEHDGYGYDEYGDEELAPVTHLPGVRAVREEQRRGSAGATDLRRIQTIKPRTYNDARVIGENISSGLAALAPSARENLAERLAVWRRVAAAIPQRHQSKPRGLIFPVGSFGHTGFTGVSMWLDPGTDTYVIVLANVIHQRGGPPIVTLSGHVATAAARALHLYGS